MKRIMLTICELFFKDYGIIAYMLNSRSVKFLGHTISSEGISVDPSKVQEVMEWKPPTSVHQIRSFLGLAGYYRHFTLDFSRIAKPMTELLKKGVKFVWDDKCEEAFHTLRVQLTTAPVLAPVSYTHLTLPTKLEV